jgi:hypothetical protein
VKILFPAEDTFKLPDASSLHVSSEKQVNALERIGKIKLASLWGRWRWLGVADAAENSLLCLLVLLALLGKVRLFSLFPSSTLCVALSVLSRDAFCQPKSLNDFFCLHRL